MIRLNRIFRSHAQTQLFITEGQTVLGATGIENKIAV